MRVRQGSPLNGGSPNFLEVVSEAIASDTLTFTGGSGSGYTVQFFFTVEGSTSETIPGLDAVNLNFIYGSDPIDGTFVSFTSPQTFVTASHEIVWDTSVPIYTDFYIQFFLHLGGVGTPSYAKVLMTPFS